MLLLPLVLLRTVEKYRPDRTTLHHEVHHPVMDKTLPGKGEHAWSEAVRPDHQNVGTERTKG